MRPRPVRNAPNALVVAAAAVLLASATEARAQFTGLVTQPRQTPNASDSATAAAASTARDSVALTRLTDMKKWVDSATVALAGEGSTGSVAAASDTVAMPARGGDIVIGRDSTADSTRGATRDSAVATPAVPPAPSQPPSQPPAMTDGARAPETATSLPTIAAAGALLIVAGLLLRRRQPARAKHK